MNHKDNLTVGIVGAGPVGLTLAARLANFKIKTIIFDKAPHLLKKGSKACLIQGDVLDILEKIGCAKQIAQEGIHWRIAHTYIKDVELVTQEYPERTGFGQFVNISQYRIEQELLSFIEQQNYSTVKWGHKVISVAQGQNDVLLKVENQYGIEEYSFRYLVACDGVHSTLRELTGAEFVGYTHPDKFLITDIKANIPLKKERHFYFDSHFNPGKQLVMHPQPGNVWRIDWQLGPNVDVVKEKEPQALHERICKVIGNVPYSIEWISIYRFNQKVVKDFKINNIFFAGDAAHSLPPYGSRGMNSGIQDVDNLAWKLALVLNGLSDHKLLETYHDERYPAALHNLQVTEATMRFIAPGNTREKLFRNLILQLSRKFKNIRKFVNHGKMSEPFVYGSSQIIEKSASSLVGQFIPDAPVFIGNEKSRLRNLLSNEFICFFFGDSTTVNNFLTEVAKIKTKVQAKFIMVMPYGSEPNIVTGEAQIVTYDDIFAYQTFYTTEPIWLIVRPDGHIAAIRSFVESEQISSVLAECSMHRAA